MNNKIKELTETIYNEGVTKAREQADNILADAQKKAEKIVATSEEQAKAILTEAKEETERINNSLRAELQAVSEQVVEITRQEIKNIVAAKASEDLARQLTDDSVFLKDLMLEIAKGWRANGANGSHPEMLIPEESAARIEKLLKAKASDVLASGVKIKPVPGLKDGFSVVNEGEGFKMSFTAEDFQTFFTALMKPKIREFLFSQENS